MPFKPRSLGQLSKTWEAARIVTKDNEPVYLLTKAHNTILKKCSGCGRIRILNHKIYRIRNEVIQKTQYEVCTIECASVILS